jgi:SpoVK/Ycf46/Vps4 family AAA+-type ATPase
VLLRGFELADAANSPGLPAGEHVDLPALAEKVPRYTGSDLRELCRVACMSPAREFLKKNLSIRTEEGGEEKGKGQVSRVSSLLKRMVSSSGSSSSPDGEIQARPLQQKDFLEAMVNVKATAVNTSRYTAFKKKLFSANR